MHENLVKIGAHSILKMLQIVLQMSVHFSQLTKCWVRRYMIQWKSAIKSVGRSPGINFFHHFPGVIRLLFKTIKYIVIGLL